MTRGRDESGGPTGCRSNARAAGGKWETGLECVGTDNLCTIQPGCKLRRVLAQAEQLQLDYLNSVRLSDIVRPGGQLLEITGPEGSEARGQRLEVRAAGELVTAF